MTSTKIKTLNKALLFLFFTLTLLNCESKISNSEPEGNTLTVFLVRHGEKVDSSKDPELSEAGKTRALKLAEVLRSTKIDHVYSSDFIRTRETAAPTAKLFDLKTQLYNPRELQSFKDKLMAEGGRSLVVGHSNSTPALVELLGGDPGTPINEASEYDRLYIVTKMPNGKVNTVLIRYGMPYANN
ncbi:phosphoglycerate mutase family protein [Gaetbulibacter aestuarii]|uniref:Phosphoglycerate mutase family protein n=1 Tax=Gaetbulibacter aestuarii TaxID=1502358 RepID=A0ABW7MV25_9FLAO